MRIDIVVSVVTLMGLTSSASPNPPISRPR